VNLSRVRGASLLSAAPPKVCAKQLTQPRAVSGNAGHVGITATSDKAGAAFCRMAFGTRLGESGADAFTIMRLMGHSTVTVSQRYVHPSPEAVELAYERMTLLNRHGAPTKVPTEAGATADVIQ
jgi:hypothetical protein